MSKAGKNAVYRPGTRVNQGKALDRIDPLFAEEMERVWTRFYRSGRKKDLVQGVTGALRRREYYQTRIPKASGEAEIGRLIAEYATDVRGFDQSPSDALI
jgi:hypothetical protein